jgi:hypothetical protein
MEKKEVKEKANLIQRHEMKCHYEERSDVVILCSELSEGISWIIDACPGFPVPYGFL